MGRTNSELDKIDKFIGHKIYSLRLAKGLSRQQLSKVIGVTHQQLQKYETRAHRVTASRLLLIAKALEQGYHIFTKVLKQLTISRWKLKANAFVLR